MEAIQMEPRPTPYEVVHLPENPTKEQYEDLAEWVLAQDGSSVRSPAILIEGGFTFTVFGRAGYLPAGREQYNIYIHPGQYLVWRPDRTWEVWTEENLNENFRVVPHNLELKAGLSFATQ